MAYDPTDTTNLEGLAPLNGTTPDQTTDLSALMPQPFQGMSGSGGGTSSGGAVPQGVSTGGAPPIANTRQDRAKVDEARAAGYTDDQIAQHLTKMSGQTSDQYKAAIAAGHTPQDIIDFYSPPNALKENTASAMAGAEAFGHSATVGLGDTIDAAAEWAARKLHGEDVSYSDLLAARKNMRDQASVGHETAANIGGVAGGVASAAATGGGPWWAQALKFGAEGGTQSGIESAESGNSAGQVALDAGKGFGINAAIPAAIHSTGAAVDAAKGAGWLPVTTQGAKEIAAAKLIEKSRLPGESYQDAATRLGTQAIDNSGSNVDGFNRTLSDAVPDSPAIAASQAKRAAQLDSTGNALKVRAAENQGALGDELHGLDPGQGAVNDADATRTANANTAYGNATLPATTTPEQLKAINDARAVIENSGMPGVQAALNKANAFNKEKGLAYTDATAPGNGSLRAYDNLKQYLDDAYSAAERGGYTKEAADILEKKTNLLTALDAASPDYQAARGGYAKDSRVLENLETTNRASNAGIAQDAIEGTPVNARGMNNVLNKEGRQLTPESAQAFANVENELKRTGRAAYSARTGQSVSQPWSQEGAENTLGSIGTIYVADKLGGGSLGASLVLAKKVISALSGPRLQEAATDLYLNPKSTGQLFMQLSEGEKREVSSALSAIAAGTARAKSTATAPVPGFSDIEGLWHQAGGH